MTNLFVNYSWTILELFANRELFAEHWSKTVLKNTLVFLVFEKLFMKINFYFIYLVSTAKSSSVAGSTLHTEHCKVYTSHYTCTCKCTCVFTCTLHSTHWTLYTAGHKCILNAAHLSFQTENILNLREWHSKLTWQNKL